MEWKNESSVLLNITYPVIQAPMLTVTTPEMVAAVQRAQVTDSTITRAFSGRWARGLRNQFMDAVEESGLKILPYPIQNALTAGLRVKAQQADRKEFTNLWSGQAAAGGEFRPSADIFARLIAEMEALH